ncbi:MAG: diacylglycerol kinase [Pseudomonadota bacterium]
MKRLVNAFLNSLSALKFGFTSENALREELILLILSLPLAPLLTQDPWTLVALWGSLLLVLSVEFLNTGVEKLADRVTTDRDDLIKIAKDCGSAAVLMSLVIAAMIWGLVAAEWLGIA